VLLILRDQRGHGSSANTSTDDGYYSGHVAYAWEHRGVVYHVTIHGHGEEPRVALMMAALIKREARR
jgi:hypothetical protein